MKEDVQKMLEAIGKSGITVAGDLVLEKNVEYEVNNVETGGIGIQVVQGKGEGAKDATDEAVLGLLDELVHEAIGQKTTPKYILLPVRAAKDAEVLPTADLKWVNERYGQKLSPTNWSTWVNSPEPNYDSRELLPLVSRFKALKKGDL